MQSTRQAAPPPLAVVAMGGHAFLQSGEDHTIQIHQRNAADISAVLMTLVERGYNLVITHGNGPQVGQLMRQTDMTREEVPPMPLDVLVADTEGWLGYILQQALLNQLRRRNIQRYVVTMVTQVLVDKRDPAFSKPSKPVGRFLSQEEGEAARDELGQGSRRRVGHRPRRGADLVGEAGDDLGVEPVGLGEPADGPGKGTDLGRVDHRQRQPRPSKPGRHRRLEAARRLEHDQGRGGRAQSIRQRGDSCPVTGDRKALARRPDVDVEPFLGDIDADEHLSLPRRVRNPRL